MVYFPVTLCNVSPFEATAVLRNATTISQRIAVRVHVNYHPSNAHFAFDNRPGQYTNH
jgi:hypothetical protein